MLPVTRQVRLSDSLLRSMVGLQAPGFTMQLVRNRGCDFDSEPLAESLLGPSATCHEATLTVVLEGSYESWDHGGHALARAGSIAFEVRDAWREQWRGQTLTLLVLHWDEAPPELALHKGVESLGSAGLRAWRGVAEALLDARDPEAGARVVHDALHAARCVGLTLAGPATTSPPPEVVALRAGLNGLLTSLHTAPQLVDLEAQLGLSARQIRRIFSRHGRWLRTSSFRKLLSSARLSAALPLLAAPDSTGAEVARALGYGSDRALYTALRNAGVRP